jgi:tetratricopeptide (TPR) repeat protein
MPPEAGNNIRTLALYNLSLVREKQGRNEDARQMREHATATLAENPAGSPDAVFQTLMADVLMELGEYRRAIPFCEQSIQLALDWNNPFLTVEVLSRAGMCYAKNGLRDHAAVPLREVVKILRTQSDDPRLPAALIALGNALRKSSPAEAERLYQEAADWHVTRAQMESATPAWSNLGVLYSETGRHAESLEHYEKALHVRERSPYTPRRLMGRLRNNIANCYRRMGRFDEAFQSLDRAIDLLTPEGGASLASAYGSRGLTLRDQGRDEEAVEWFRKSCAEHEKQPSPNLETVAEELKKRGGSVAPAREAGGGSGSGGPTGLGACRDG